jgi:metallophosphoesterase superfamily enzyme
MFVRVHHDWLLTPYRVAVHEPTATAVIADVHLGYCEARQQSGDAIPLRTVASQLAPLRRARTRFRFDKLLVAGDLFERAVQSDLLDAFLAELAALEITFAGLVPGNHDRGWEAFQERIPIFPGGVEVGASRVIHGDSVADAEQLVLGHWHPVIIHQDRRRPCYLVGPRRLVLPAYSTDAAGVSVTRQPALRGLRRFAIMGNTVGLSPHVGNVRSTRAR